MVGPLDGEKQEVFVNANLSNAESQRKKRQPFDPATKQFNRCTLNVRDFPLERFRLPRDGRKWKQAARSRSDLLLKLSTYANPDGTFESADGNKNFSPSAKKLLRHYAKNTFYRLSNDLRELGLLSWEREQKHYGRRTYKIHLESEKQVPHSHYHVPDSREKQVPDSQRQVPLRDLITGSMMGTNPSLEPSVVLGSVGRSDSIVPSRAAGSLDNHHPSSKETARSDKDDRERVNSPRLVESPAEKKRDEDSERVRIHILKTTALSRFNAKHSGRVDPSLLKLRLDDIEKRAKGRIQSANYFLTGLENELVTQVETMPTPDENSPSPDSTDENSYFERATSFWAHKLALSLSMPIESARAKVSEFLNEKGFFKSWETCRDFFAMIRTDVFPKTPEPRKNGEKDYFPETVLVLFDLVNYSWDTPELCGFGSHYNKVIKYLLCIDKFEAPEERRKFEDLIAHRQEQKNSDEERRQYRDKVNRRRRERRAEKKARDSVCSVNSDMTNSR